MKKTIFLILMCFMLTSGWAQLNKTSTLMVGDSLPNISLKNMSDSTILLGDAYINQPMVIIFYRANWCPFCNQHLSDLQSYFKPLMKLGYKLIAISTESVENLQKTKENNYLKYPLLSDFSKEGIKSFGIVNGSVAVPSVFIIGKNHLIKYIHTNTDYKVRLSGETIYEQAKQLMEK